MICDNRKIKKNSCHLKIKVKDWDGVFQYVCQQKYCFSLSWFAWVRLLANIHSWYSRPVLWTGGYLLLQNIRWETFSGKLLEKKHADCSHFMWRSLFHYCFGVIKHRNFSLKEQEKQQSSDRFSPCSTNAIKFPTDRCQYKPVKRQLSSNNSHHTYKWVLTAVSTNLLTKSFHLTVITTLTSKHLPTDSCHNEAVKGNLSSNSHYYTHK